MGWYFPDLGELVETEQHAQDADDDADEKQIILTLVQVGNLQICLAGKGHHWREQHQG
jgi:hypothetical protein